jgi:hypothetical protein
VEAQLTRRLLNVSKLGLVATSKDHPPMLMSNHGNVDPPVLLLLGKSEATIVVDMIPAMRLLKEVQLLLGPGTVLGMTIEETIMVAKMAKLLLPQEVLLHHGNKVVRLILQLPMLVVMVVTLPLDTVVIRLHPLQVLLLLQA